MTGFVSSAERQRCGRPARGQDPGGVGFPGARQSGKKSSSPSTSTSTNSQGLHTLPYCGNKVGMGLFCLSGGDL